MRQTGTITRWNDERGFGFVTPDTGAASVFVHVSAFGAARRPVVGEVITFVATRDDRQRLRASDVMYVGSSAASWRPARGVSMATAVGAVFFGVLAILAAREVVPGLAMAWWALMSLVAFVLYRADKSAANRGAWRISESTLQTVSLLGGWPGALLAQRVYRHKTRKTSFQAVFWTVVVVNCAALAWMVIGRPVPF